ncbi:hypothetical protein [Klenkia soli]|uniref:hypothetical protein n=1 Tax=Klenkia soli TaxID=1052260 RepID=UPI001041EAED|nr:hypothetical protein [Klenkia soli]
MGLLCLLGVSGCAGFAGATPAPPSTTAPTTTTTARTTTAPAYTLPETCAGLLTVSQVSDALGARLPGTTTYVVGEAEPGIGRTGRVTCGYGVTPATATAGASDPILEVSVFTYTDPGAAAARVEALVAARRAEGEASGAAAVPGADAVLLTGPAETTLVATVDSRTYALTLVPGLLDAPATRTALETLASVAAGTTTSPSAGRPAGTSSSAPTG